MRSDDKLSCPNCGYLGSAVTDTDAQKTYVRRRRECKNCGFRFTTVEISVAGSGRRWVADRVERWRRNENTKEV